MKLFQLGNLLFHTFQLILTNFPFRAKLHKWLDHRLLYTFQHMLSWLYTTVSSIEYCYWLHCSSIRIKLWFEYLLPYWKKDQTLISTNNIKKLKVHLSFGQRNHLFSFTLLAVRVRRQFSRETSEKCKEKMRYLFAYIPRHSPMTFCPHLSSDLWSARSLELTKPFRIGNYISHHPQERRTLQRILPFQNQRGIVSHVLICTFTNRLQSAIAVICHNPVLWLIT